MRKRSLITLMGVFALALGGCGGEETATAPSPEAASPSPTAAAPASPAPAPAAGKPAPAAGKPGFKKPVVAAKPTAPGLIQSTSADARVNQIRKGRKDPFALLPNVVPVPKVPKNPDGTPVKPVQRTVPRVRNLPSGVKPAGTTNSPTVIGRRPGGTLPGGSSPVAIAPPPPPDPTTAKAVVVTGVVTIGNQPMIILKAPDEPTSRYVSVGQTLSNGEVRVKRIDDSADGPVVILEQYGVEVAKVVGEKPVGTSTPGQPAS